MIGDLRSARKKAFKKFLQKYFPEVTDINDPSQVICSRLILEAFKEYYKNEFWEEAET